MNSIYTIIFEDGSTYKGGESFEETKWLDMPHKKIKNLFYKLPTGDYLTLSGYKKYYHFVEKVIDFNLKGSQGERIECVNIMGTKGNKVRWYKIILSPKKNNKIGDIVSEVYDLDEKFLKKFNPEGWKDGI